MRTFIASMLGVVAFCSLHAQQVTNKNFSVGSYGRVGIASGDSLMYPRSLNLNGMGSIGGRMEEVDYFELAMALHFTPVSNKSDTTQINIQSRIAFYTTQGQLIGNVTSNLLEESLLRYRNFLLR